MISRLKIKGCLPPSGLNPSTGLARDSRKPGLLKGLLAFGLAFALVAVTLPAWNMAEAEPLRRIGQNPRGLAMGGTGISYSNDEMALYYNPAGLSAIKNFWVELLPISVEVSGDAVELVKSGDFGNFDDPAGLIRQNIGKELQARTFVYPHAVFNIDRNFSVGYTYFQEIQVEMRIRNQATPEIEAFYQYDKGRVVGVGFPMGEGKYLGGVSARKVTRQTGSGTISSAALALSSAAGELDLEKELNVGEGTGIGYDLGLIWRMESFASLRGQYALVINNFGGTDLGDAGEIPQEVSMGWAFRPRFSPMFPVLFAFELRDVTFALSDDTSQNKRTHAGLEVGVIPQDDATNLVTGRVGYHAGSTSYGLEISFWHFFTLQYVVYFEEFGEKAGQDPRERRLLMVNFIGF